MTKFYASQIGRVLVIATLLVSGATSAIAQTAFPMQMRQVEQSIAQRSEEVASSTPRPDREARSAVRAVRRDMAQQLDIRRRDVQIVSIDRQTWPNGCLGLPQPGQFCTQALIEGWRVTARANNQTWVYRTNASGEVVRRETATTPDGELPQAIRTRVLQTASEQFNVPVRQLRVASAEQRTWNGCLGISEPGVMCTMIAIFGWRVTVTDGAQQWVYHTNQDASQVRLNPAASSIGGTISPTPIPAENLPQPLERGVLFRSITSGGIAGEHRQVTLYEDGRVVVQPRRGQSESFRVPQPQVDRFRQLLADQQFDRFDRLDFSAGAGAADYFTVMLISRNSVAQYADIVADRLPPALQQVIQAWNRDIVPSQQNPR